MASGEEKGLMGNKKKQGKRARGAGSKVHLGTFSRKECWDFGKKLGLIAPQGDEAVVKYLEGVREGSGSLGVGGKANQ